MESVRQAKKWKLLHSQNELVNQTVVSDEYQTPATSWLSSELVPLTSRKNCSRPFHRKEGTAAAVDADTL